MVESANMARRLLGEMEKVPDNEQFDIFEQEQDKAKRIEEMYIKSIGIKMLV